MSLIEWIGTYGITVIGVLIAVIVLISIIYRIVRSKTYPDSSEKKYAGSVMNVFDPITGLPRSMVDKTAVIEYIDEHIVEYKIDSEEVAGEPPAPHA